MKTEDILLELGKGSTRRPNSVPDKTFNENWDRIWGNKKNEDKQNDKKKSS